MSDVHHDWGLPVGLGCRVALGTEHWGTRSDRSGTVPARPAGGEFPARAASTQPSRCTSTSATMVVGQAAQRTTATMVVGQAVAGIGGAAL